MMRRYRLLPLSMVLLITMVGSTGCTARGSCHRAHAAPSEAHLHGHEFWFELGWQATCLSLYIVLEALSHR